MNIRPATTEDTTALMRLFHFLDETYKDDAAAIETALAHPATTIFVMEENGEIIATGTISHRASPRYGRVAYLDDVVVDPEFRGRGLGRAISEYCVQYAREQKCIRMELTSRPSRTAANELYKSMGFTLRETNAYVMNL